jgi:HAD superfamily hydrolase (TIGR01490 family)
MKKVAVFDVDGTIFRSSLLIELVETLIERGVFPEETRAVYKRAHEKWTNRQGEYQTYINAVVGAFMKHIKGVEYSDFEEAVKMVMSANKDKVYRYTRDLIKDLKKKGYYLLAISHSPKGAVEPFCKRLGFNKVYGIFYELGPTDRFTGKMMEEHLILNKSAILKRALQKENLTLKGSIAVGDTESDLPLFEMVETPICFNPNMLLYKVALRNKWKVVVERKDVIYTLENK